MVILIIVMVGGIYYQNAPIVSMSRNVTSEEPVANGCGFTIDTTKEIVVKYASNVDKGNMTIRLTDENWNTIKEFQSNVEGRENLKLEKGKYYMRIESDNFTGSYRLKVYD